MVRKDLFQKKLSLGRLPSIFNMGVKQVLRYYGDASIPMNSDLIYANWQCVDDVSFNMKHQYRSQERFVVYAWSRQYFSAYSVSTSSDNIYLCICTWDDCSLFPLPSNADTDCMLCVQIDLFSVVGISFSWFSVLYSSIVLYVYNLQKNSEHLIFIMHLANSLLWILLLGLLL